MQMRSYHFGDSQAPLGRKPLGQSLLRHLHGHVAGFVVPGSEPALVGPLTRCLQYLSDDERFKLGGSLLNRIGLRSLLRKHLMKTAIFRRALADLLRIRTRCSYHCSG